MVTHMYVNLAEGPLLQLTFTTGEGILSVGFLRGLFPFSRPLSDRHLFFCNLNLFPFQVKGRIL